MGQSWAPLKGLKFPVDSQSTVPDFVDFILPIRYSELEPESSNDSAQRTTYRIVRVKKNIRGTRVGTPNAHEQLQQEARSWGHNRSVPEQLKVP